ncbi:receptor-like protein kinase FERONIA [Vigna radiata var. radiata]|uniref:non-specific serine/threonine protein kinase n=1 Tax=Vigna radiata var. radiata TaxID=3916 RepID=A0A1S3TWJ7_VIGRR|nr:receptor-like protein kinase FERONIA [Vigna radiata var. radiata]
MFLKCFGESSSSGRQYPTVIEELCRHFSLADIQKSTNNFDHKRLIARGAWVKVYKGCLQHIDGSDYAVAVRRFKEEESETFKREVELLCQLHHPNCVSIVGFCNHEKEKIIVHEYLSNGSLDRYLVDDKVREALPWKKRIEICIGSARGLHYLHAGLKRTIIHRNINSASILLDDNMHPKLSSFGLSIMGAHFKEKSKPIQTDIVGHAAHLPPEYIKDGTVTHKCDVYAFGVVLLQVVVRGTSIFPMLEELMGKCVEENIDPKIKGKIAPECWQVFIDIALRCMKDEPEERPEMGEVEVQLEFALLLQEQADVTNINSYYTLSSKTIITRKCEWRWGFDDVANKFFKYSQV